MSKTLFEKIIDGEIPADLLYEDEHCVAFRDVNPQAPFHVLLVPRKPIARLSHANAEDVPLLGHLLVVAPRIAREHGHDDFRVVINNGPTAGQSVYHLHLHILAGRAMGWPPG